jgi:hypothetical protein
MAGVNKKKISSRGIDNFFYSIRSINDQADPLKNSREIEGCTYYYGLVFNEVR